MGAPVKACVGIFLLVIAALLVALIVVVPIIYVILSEREQYALVIDAGSSHSKTFLYTWKLPYHDETAQIYELTSCESEGKGISSYASNPSQAGPSLYNCTNELLTEYVPSDVYNSEPYVNVWLGATAGMRLLDYQNENASDEILNSVTDTLTDLHTTNDVQILPGVVEGASGWISSNYIAGRFRYKYPVREVESRTVGALDMGGASTQISFVPSEVAIPPKFQAEVTLFGDTFTTYSRSYLCFGINEASRRLLAFFAKEADYEKELEFPCLLKEDNITWDGAYLFYDSPCTEDLNSSKVLRDDEFTFYGTGETAQCEDLVQRALNFSKCVIDYDDCDEADPAPPPPIGEFMAFSVYYYTASAFYVNTIDSSSIDDFYTNVSYYCQNLTISEAIEECEKNDACNPAYASRNCIQGIYVLHVLINEYGFSSKRDDWSIFFTKKINGISTGWTLGYMLNQTNSLEDIPYHITTPFPLYALIVILVVLVLGLLGSIILFIIIVLLSLRRAGYSKV